MKLNAEPIARYLASPIAIIGLAVLFGVLPRIMSVDVITYILSVMALTICQMVLAVQFADKDSDALRDQAMHAKLDEVLRAIPQASNDLMGIERKEIK